MVLTVVRKRRIRTCARLSPFACILASLLLAACSGSGSNSGAAPPTQPPPPPAAPSVGTLEVESSSNGMVLDLDGYSATLDDSLTVALSDSSPAFISGIPEGSHGVRVGGLAWNCTVANQQHSVDVSANDTVATTFDVSCPPGGELLLSKYTPVYGTVSLYTIHADGTNLYELQPLGQQPGDQGASWSPDGTVIAFVGGSGDDQIYLTNSQGHGSQLLLDSTGVQYVPQISPDGKTLVFQELEGTIGHFRYDLATVGVDGSGHVDLTNDSLTEYTPAWSPDGHRIAYQGQDPLGGIQIYAVNSDGTNRTELTTTLGQKDWPSWSPDGTQIAFSSSPQAYDDIYVMNSDGTGIRQVSAGPNDSHPIWSPDGRLIAFTRQVGSNTEVYLMRPDGSDTTRFTTDSAKYIAWSWIR